VPVRRVIARFNAGIGATVADCTSTVYPFDPRNSAPRKNELACRPLAGTRAGKAAEVETELIGIATLPQPTNDAGPATKEADFAAKMS